MQCPGHGTFILVVLSCSLFLSPLASQGESAAKSDKAATLDLLAAVKRLGPGSDNETWLLAARRFLTPAKWQPANAWRQVVNDPERLAELEAAIGKLADVESRALVQYSLSHKSVDPAFVLGKLARGSHSNLRRDAIAALQWRDSGFTRSVLRKLAKHEDAISAALAVHAVAALELRDKIVKKAKDDAADLPKGVPRTERLELEITALAESGSQTALPRLVELLEDSSVLSEAAQALGRLRSLQVRDALLKQLVPPFYRRHMVAWALSRLSCTSKELHALLKAPLAKFAWGLILEGRSAELRVSGDLADRALEILLAAKAHELFLLKSAVRVAWLATSSRGARSPELSAVVVKLLEKPDADRIALTLAEQLAMGPAKSQDALRKLATEPDLPLKTRAAILATLANIAEPKDKTLANKWVGDKSLLVRGAALDLLAAADPKNSRAIVLEGLKSLNPLFGKAFRPGLRYGLRALGRCAQAKDTRLLLAISKYRVALDVKYGAFEGLLQLGDRDAVREWFKQNKRSSSYLAIAATAMLEAGWLDCKDLLLPLLESKAMRRFASLGDIGGMLLGHIPVREVLVRDLVHAYKTNPGGWDHASRAIAWKTWLRQKN